MNKTHHINLLCVFLSTDDYFQQHNAQSYKPQITLNLFVEHDNVTLLSGGAGGLNYGRAAEKSMIFFLS